MTYVLKYSSILFTKNTIGSRFGGSSKYKVIDDELIDASKEKKHKEKTTKKKAKKKSIHLETEEKQEVKKTSEEQKKKKGYTLNKSKVKRKCRAFSRLEKSKKFLAFYSISFPQGLGDEVCYKLFNTWLTRCRKNGGLFSYLWVAERQNNGTVHFHLLTNDFMKIEVVNGFMASALKTEKKKGNEILKEVVPEKYNGVDVKRVGKDKRLLINYLAKYITKNEIEFYRLPWHCSRDISKLFTAINFEEEVSDKIFDELPYALEHYTPVTYTEYYNVAGFKFTPKESLFNDLDSANEVVYNTKD